MVYSEAIYNGSPLNVTNITPTRRQRSLKQVVGKTFVQTNIIGRTVQQWELQISGVVLGTTTANLSTNRSNLEGSDDVDYHAYTDGLHNGTYIVQPGSLKFDDNAQETANTRYVYSFLLVQE